jgi:hypothetical protein
MTTATAGQTHDAVLDNQGLLLLPNSLRRQDVTSFSPQVRSTEPRYNDFSLTQKWVQRSFHHGRGAFEVGDPYAFYDATNVDSAVLNQLTLAALQNLTTKAAAASLAGNPVFFRLITSAANLYCGTGGGSRDIFAWDNTSNVWAAETAGLAADPTDMAEFLGVIWVACGEANNMRKKSAGVWADGGVPADLVLSFGNASLYRADNLNEIYYTVDGTTWQGPVYVGDTNTQIRGMCIHDSKLYIGKDDGLYYLQDGRAYQLLDFQFARDSNNFKNMKSWQGALYFPILDGLYRLIGSALQAIGPDLGAAGAAEQSSFVFSPQDTRTFKSLASGKTGRIVDLVPTDNWLFAAIDGVAGTSQIVKFNGSGWHQVLEGAATNKRIRAIFYTGSLAASNTLLNPRLWYGYDTDAYNAIMPFGTEDPYEYSLQTYCTTGTLTSPWHHAGMPLVFKEYQYILMESEGLTSTETVQVSYEMDDLGSFTNLTDAGGSSYAFTFGPFQVIFFPRNTVCRKMRLKFTLARGSTTTLTPKVRGVTTSFMLRPDTLYSWQVTARCGDKIHNPYTEQVEQRVAGEWVELLERYRGSRSRLDWDDGYMEPGITNLALNSIFRVDSNSDGLADNWTKVGAPTTSFDVTKKQIGLRSQKCVTGTTLTQGVVSDAMTTAVGSYYTGSVYLLLETGDAVTLQMLDAASNVIAATKVSALATSFVRVECTAQAPTTTCTLRVVRLTGDATQATTFYISAVQFELTPLERITMPYLTKATTFCSGDEARGRWTGRPYTSTATRAAAYAVYVSNINRVEIERPSFAERIRGRRPETHVTFSLVMVE